MGEPNICEQVRNVWRTLPGKYPFDVKVIGIDDKNSGWGTSFPKHDSYFLNVPKGKEMSSFWIQNKDSGWWQPGVSTPGSDYGKAPKSGDVTDATKELDVYSSLLFFSMPEVKDCSTINFPDGSVGVGSYYQLCDIALARCGRDKPFLIIKEDKGLCFGGLFLVPDGSYGYIEGEKDSGFIYGRNSSSSLSRLKMMESSPLCHKQYTWVPRNASTIDDMNHSSFFDPFGSGRFVETTSCIPNVKPAVEPANNAQLKESGTGSKCYIVDLDKVYKNDFLLSQVSKVLMGVAPLLVRLNNQDIASKQSDKMAEVFAFFLNIQDQEFRRLAMTLYNTNLITSQSLAYYDFLSAMEYFTSNCPDSPE